MRRRRVILLGATGSIGQSAIKVAEAFPDQMTVVGMAAWRSADGLASAANRLRPEQLCLVDSNRVPELRRGLCYEPEILSGAEGLETLVRTSSADMVLVAIIGTAGLHPALAAIETGKDLAIASKEILVMAGEIVMQRAIGAGIQVLPVDSEHNAIFQCLDGKPATQIRKLILTASGGPFRTWPKEDLEKVRPEQALKHPTWNMGQKITIDSATLFNKGLEMIEARWLFGVEMPKVEVVVHPQSIVHSLVEFVDGSILAQLSHSDMCFPIQYAVTWPDRWPNQLRPLRLAELGHLDFEEPRYEDFPALRLARQAGEAGGVAPAVLNAANEIAVEAFLKGEIRFPQIWQTVDAALSSAEHFAHPSLDDILRADRLARQHARRALSLN
ncbi:MAG: 1-deoxy-D-xylulose-5-phosphate reductoisomerase [Verrucomicrobia bacterium]|nr:1-deoxy-D-xylulose-5-phosphate reductoisomerase [Verrucomicrobiota bacterium]